LFAAGATRQPRAILEAKGVSSSKPQKKVVVAESWDDADSDDDGDGSADDSPDEDAGPTPEEDVRLALQAENRPKLVLLMFKKLKAAFDAKFRKSNSPKRNLAESLVLTGRNMAISGKRYDNIKTTITMCISAVHLVSRSDTMIRQSHPSFFLSVHTSGSEHHHAPSCSFIAFFSSSRANPTQVPGSTESSLRSRHGPITAIDGPAKTLTKVPEA
jgi:hypothetical protein